MFSKLQTFKLFAMGSWNLSRELMMDAEMILNGTGDEISSGAVPAAVMMAKRTVVYTTGAPLSVISKRAEWRSSPKSK